MDMLKQREGPSPFKAYSTEIKMAYNFPQNNMDIWDQKSPSRNWMCKFHQQQCGFYGWYSSMLQHVLMICKIFRILQQGIWPHYKFLCDYISVLITIGDSWILPLSNPLLTTTRLQCMHTVTSKHAIFTALFEVQLWESSLWNFRNS